MSHGRVIRGIIFSHEEIIELEKHGLTGELLDLYLSYLHLYQVQSVAHACYDAYWELWTARNRTREQPALPVHHFKDFFVPVEHSLWNNTILSLAHLVEEDKRTLNIRTFLDDLDAKKNLFRNFSRVTHVVGKCRKKLDEEETSTMIKELLKYRHNVVAHKSYKMPNSISAFRIAPLTIGSPRELLERMDPVLEELHRNMFGKEVVFAPYFKKARQDTRQVIHLLSQFLRRAE